MNKIKINFKKKNKQLTINKANDTVSPVPQNQQKTRQSITKKNKQTKKKQQRIAKKNPHKLNKKKVNNSQTKNKKRNKITTIDKYIKLKLFWRNLSRIHLLTLVSLPLRSLPTSTISLCVFLSFSPVHLNSSLYRGWCGRGQRLLPTVFFFNPQKTNTFFSS